MFFMMALLVVGFVLWVAAMVDLMRRRKERSDGLLAWLITVLFFPLVGSMIYFLWGKNQTSKRSFQPQFNSKA